MTAAVPAWATLTPAERSTYREAGSLPPEPTPLQRAAASVDIEDGWPHLEDAAYHGPLGEYVKAATPYTEADPAAILAQALAGVGCLANRNAHVLAGNEAHPAALFVVIVGSTSRGKKGTAWAGARIVLEKVDPIFTASRIMGGFGSGEILIQTLAGVDPDATSEDTGPHDTRLILHEGELASFFKVGGRKDSTLAQVIRNGWDGQPLQARTRGKGTVVATNYHLTLIGHITAEELRVTLSSSDTFGGTTNRLLFIGARRQRLLPEGGNIPAELADKAGAAIRANLKAVRTAGRYERTEEAKTRWADLYAEMAVDVPPGILGAATARAEAQCTRLALTYAIADGSRVIDVDHLDAAWALWRYSRATAEVVFPTTTSTADTILAAALGAGSGGLERTAIYRLLGNNLGKPGIDAAIAGLVKAGLAEERTTPAAGGKGGRPLRLVIATATGG